MRDRTYHGIVRDAGDEETGAGMCGSTTVLSLLSLAPAQGNHKTSSAATRMRR
jgi:hypothetical protein